MWQFDIYMGLYEWIYMTVLTFSKSQTSQPQRNWNWRPTQPVSKRTQLEPGYIVWKHVFISYQSWWNWWYRIELCESYIAWLTYFWQLTFFTWIHLIFRSRTNKITHTHKIKNIIYTKHHLDRYIESNQYQTLGSSWITGELNKITPPPPL